MAITISGNGITSANIADGTITTDDILASDVSSLKSGRKNLIINGDFQVSQRGDYTSATTITPWAYTVDRWKSTVSAVSGTSQYTNDILKLTATSTVANARILATQGIEMMNIVPSKVYTYSVKVKSNSADARIAIYINGGWAGSSAHSGSGSWEDLSVEVTSDTAPQTAECWVRVGIMDGSGNASISITSGDYLEVREPQLELGSVATDFEHRSYGEELALCQRYYFKSAPALGVGSLQGRYMYRNYEHIWLAVRMRGTPTFTSSSSFAPNRIFHDGWTNDASPTGGDMLVCELDAEL